MAVTVAVAEHSVTLANAKLLGKMRHKSTYTYAVDLTGNTLLGAVFSVAM